MALPAYVWRIDELEAGKSLHVTDDLSMELKVAADTYRVWLEHRADGPYVRVDELVESVASTGAVHTVWKTAEFYKAEPQQTKLLPASL